MPSKFLTAEWKNLIMANYVVDPEVLKPYLPAHTMLDEFNGKTYVSLVGFMFANTRLLGYKFPWHVNFEEVNLRFYVKHLDNGIWKRGVVFIREIVPRHAIRIIANLVYREKYSSMPMKNFFSGNAKEMEVGYHWKFQGDWNRLEATTSNKAIPIQPGSEEEFIAEHYWGYSRNTEHVTYKYEVQHPRWNIYPVKKYLIDCDFEKLYGSSFAFLQGLIPSSVFMAEGSAISVLKRKMLG